MSELPRRNVELDLDEEAETIDGEQAFFNRAHQIPFIDKDSLSKVCFEAQQGEQEARQRIMATNIMLVARYAGSMSRNRHNMTKFDLIQEGIIGLNDAIDQYDVERTVPFTLFAISKIRKSLQRAVRLQDGAFPMTQDQYELSSKQQKAWGELCQELQCEPSIDEVADRCRVDANKLSQLDCRHAMEPISYDKQYVNEYGIEYEMRDNIPDENGQDPVPMAIESKDLERSITFLLSELEPQDAELLRLRHGFDGDKVNACANWSTTWYDCSRSSQP